MLEKSPYPLKQAARSWRNLLISTLRKLALERDLSDPYILCLRDSKTKGLKLILSVHVGEIVIVESEEDCALVARDAVEILPCKGSASAYVVYV